MSERDEVQGARSTEHETYQMDRRVGEHRATPRRKHPWGAPQFARVAIYSAPP
jgi:hypothetical protein